MSGEIAQLTQEVVEWADSVLPDRKPQSALLKLFEETGELVKDPASAGEYADICIMIFDLAHMHKVDLSKAIRDKLELNRRRTWTTTASGTLQHFPGLSVVDQASSAGMRGIYEQGKADAAAGLSRGATTYASSEERYWHNRGYDMGVGE